MAGLYHRVVARLHPASRECYIAPMPPTQPPRNGPSEPHLGRLAHLPDVVRQEIDLYLGEGETLIDALFSASGPVGRLGELWLVVSDRSLYFYTREHGQNPVVALIARSDVKQVTYSMTSAGVTLTFQPAAHPLNTVRVPFPKAQIKDVNELCEGLAKSIPFVMDQPQPPRALPDKQPEAPAAPGNSTGPAQSAIPTPVPMPAPAPTPKPPSTAKPAAPVVAAPAPAAITPTGTAATSAPLSSASPDADTPSTPRFAFPELKEPQGLRFIALATLISLCVGFLWYRLFQAISDRR